MRYAVFGVFIFVFCVFIISFVLFHTILELLSIFTGMVNISKTKLNNATYNYLPDVFLVRIFIYQFNCTVLTSSLFGQE